MQGQEEGTWRKEGSLGWLPEGGENHSPGGVLHHLPGEGSLQPIPSAHSQHCPELSGGLLQVTGPSQLAARPQQVRRRSLGRGQGHGDVTWLHGATRESLVCPSPPVLHLIIPLTGHPQCPPNASSSIFTLSLKTEEKKRQEVGKAKGQVVSREAPSEGSRQAGSSRLQRQRTSAPLVQTGTPRTPRPDPEEASNTISPNLGFKSTDVQRG